MVNKLSIRQKTKGTTRTRSPQLVNSRGVYWCFSFDNNHMSLVEAKDFNVLIDKIVIFWSAN